MLQPEECGQQTCLIRCIRILVARCRSCQKILHQHQSCRACGEQMQAVECTCAIDVVPNAAGCMEIIPGRHECSAGRILQPYTPPRWTPRIANQPALPSAGNAAGAHMGLQFTNQLKLAPLLCKLKVICQRQLLGSYSHLRGLSSCSLTPSEKPCRSS